MGLADQNNIGDTYKRDTPVLNREEEEQPKSAVPLEVVPEQIISGRYKVINQLGKGGMGFVYLVEEISSGRKFALKTISSEKSERAFKRFQLEARATSLLKHPNIVQIEDFGWIGDDHPFFVMEYSPGQTLSEAIKAKGPFEEKNAIDLFIVICNALAYAHCQSIVHRDIKPSNIMLSNEKGRELEIKVLDFGIAKVFRDETAFNTLTRTGEIFGSPFYMSPEQCLGREIDLRSDIYSLGCVFFEMLTGHPPFLSDNALTTMLKHQTEAPISLSEATLGKKFTSGVEHIVATMLAKNPNDRYPNLLQAVDDLRTLQRGSQLKPRMSPQEMAKSESKRRKPVLIASISAVTLVIATLLFFMLQPASKTDNHRPMSIYPPTDLPDMQSLRPTKTPHVTNYYSDGITNHSGMRTFNFPPQPIGSYGHGYDEERFTSAKGPCSIRVPMGFIVTGDYTVLSGFRPDEIEKLSTRGVAIDDSAIELIKNWQTLKYLGVNQTDVTDKSIATLQGLPPLWGLSVVGTNLSARGLCRLNFDSIRYLNVDQVQSVNELLPKLRSSSQLVRLDLASTGLKDADLKAISQIPHLLTLDIRDNAITDQGFSELAKSSSLKDVWLSGTRLTPRCIETIQKMPHLRSLTILLNSWSPKERADFISAAKKVHCQVRYH